MSEGEKTFEEFAKKLGLTPGYDAWRLARDAWVQGVETANVDNSAASTAAAEKMREECATICEVGVKWTPPLSEHPEKLSRETAYLLGKAIRSLPLPGPDWLEEHDRIVIENYKKSLAK